MSEQLKIHASGAGNLMVNPRSGKGMSETAKKYLFKYWIEEKYKRYQDFSNRCIEKGLINEEKSITVLTKYTGAFYEKNYKIYQNDYLIGTPDVVDDETDTVIDLKTSWDIFTFGTSELTSLYEYQLLCYMELTGKKKGILAYALTDTPEALIDVEVGRIMRKIGYDYTNPEYNSEKDRIKQEVTREWTYPDIPSHDKIRLFHLEHDESKIAELYKRIEAAREYYATLSLSNVKTVEV